MATTKETIISTKPKAKATVALEPAHNGLASLFLVAWVDEMQGVSDWVKETAVALTPAQRHTHRLIFEGLIHALYPEQGWPSFPDYLAAIARQDPVVLRNRLLDMYLSMPGHYGEPTLSLTREELLQSQESFLTYLLARFSSDYVNVPLEQEAYALLKEPAKMQGLIHSHLQMMWQKFLATEWQRTKPLLQASVEAFQQIELGHLSHIEAARLVTDQELHTGWDRIVIADRVIFVPSPHIGPYLHKMKVTIDGQVYLWLLFGARIPEGVSVSVPELSRSELLVRLNALADDTRLRMLRLLAESGELCAPDIMQALDLSQSATSRHIRQLSATGYVSERRREGAKCYTLNLDRVETTWQALARFLKS